MKRVVIIALMAILVAIFGLQASAWLFTPGDDGTICQGGAGYAPLPNWMDITESGPAGNGT